MYLSKTLESETGRKIGQLWSTSMNNVVELGSFCLFHCSVVYMENAEKSLMIEETAGYII